jgi:hypothetical protein
MSAPWFARWLRSHFRHARRPRRPRTVRPAPDVLEDRTLLQASPLPAPATPSASIAALPLSFQANQGQAPAGVDFQAHGAGQELLAGGNAVLADRFPPA